MAILKVKLSKEAYDRLDNFTPINHLADFNHSIDEITVSLFEEGFEVEDIYAWLKLNLYNYLTIFQKVQNRIGKPLVITGFADDGIEDGNYTILSINKELNSYVLKVNSNDPTETMEIDIEYAEKYLFSNM